MISYSHWGMFPAPPVYADAANNFYGVMQTAQLSQQASAINKMYDNCVQVKNGAVVWYGRLA